MEQQSLHAFEIDSCSMTFRNQRIYLGKVDLGTPSGRQGELIFRDESPQRDFAINEITGGLVGG
jgi:hypothetical protein